MKTIMEEALAEVRRKGQLKTLERVMANRKVDLMEELHPKTEALVNTFAAALKAKLLKAQQKYGYSDNWATDDWEAECRQHLMDHIQKGDPLDVAAYAAFMWKRGWSTADSPAHISQMLGPTSPDAATPSQRRPE